ncbi:Uncharacterised protein [uncultured archaeon]|nr:Uncharacterised protein [uncultured archaeon]
MKRWMILSIITLFLIGFISAGITSRVIENVSGDTTNNSGNVTVGGSCGTVSPESRESCCKERGYESWSDEKGTCEGLKSNEDNKTQKEQEHNSVISAREDHLSEKEKTEITAETQGTQSKVKIDKRIYTNLTNQDDIVAEVISKFAMTKDEVNNLLKLESGGEDQSGIHEESNFKVEVNLNSGFSAIAIEKTFVLNTTNRDEILNSIVTESQLTADEVKSAIEMKDLKDVRKEEHRLKFENAQCPLGCECMGSVIRCEFENGTRIMTITAGESGNMIVQIKGENMTTNVTLYKSGEKVYGIFSGNETKEIKVLPDQVKENIKAKIKAKLQNEDVKLNGSGTYEYNAEKQARLFLIIPVKVPVKAEIDSSTGTVSQVQQGQWWSFLAKDE